MSQSVTGARKGAGAEAKRENDAREPLHGRGLSHFPHGSAGQEHIKTIVVHEHEAMSVLVADRIAALIKERNAAGDSAVLGLATGSTPIGVYRELVRKHKTEGLSFKNVVTFNLDEYFPMPKESIHSYHRFMWENLFSHVDVNPANVHIPDGTIARDRVDEY